MRQKTIRYAAPRRWPKASTGPGRAATLSDVLMLALVIPIAIVALAGGTLAANAAAGPAYLDCGRGVPLEKCNEGLNSKPGVDIKNPILPDQLEGAKDDAQMVTCGQTFFDEKTASELSDHFGLLWCLRVDPAGVWALVGSGMSLTADAFEAAPGGAIVATLACASADKECSDADSKHDFADFAVSYPPLPMSGRTNLQSVENGRFLMIANGFCGLFAYDVITSVWLSGSEQDRSALVKGSADVPTVQVPEARSGDLALAGSPPTGTGDCQSMKEDN